MTVPSAPVTGLTGDVTSRTVGCAGGRPISVMFTVTSVPGSKPTASTTKSEVWAAWLVRTMHIVGAVTPAMGVPLPHTVGGAGGGPPGGGPGESPELVSEAPRTTPTAIRAAPTEAQSAQPRWVLIHRRQPAGSQRGPAHAWARNTRRSGPGVRGLGRKEAGRPGSEALVASSLRSSGAGPPAGSGVRWYSAISARAGSGR